MIHLANYEPNRLGGGWTAARYLHAGLECVEYDDAEYYLIMSPTMVSYHDVEQAKAIGKKIILRVDNVVKNSRNRNTGMSRMKAFAEQSDLIIYQSQWAKDYLMPFIEKDGVVILNGADPEVFNTHNRNTQQGIYTYSRYNRDESKNWEFIRYWFSRKWQEDKNAHLYIIGKFSRENLEYNFDFFQNERYTFFGEQPQASVAGLLKQSSHFLYSYFMDACSNSLIEARLSGCEIVDVHGMLQTGGAPEIMQASLNDLTVDTMVKNYKEAIYGL